MTVKHAYGKLISLVLAALLLGSCAPAASNASLIATSVAQTVEAPRNGAGCIHSNVHPTPADPYSDQVTHTAHDQGAPDCAGTRIEQHRGLLQRAIRRGCEHPDGTIVAPGASFWKTWSVKNTGSCSWDSSFKFVFVDGDIMGGAYVYNFPGFAAPDDIVEIPIQLYAPTTTGSYSGYWKIQAPDKTLFGVGPVRSIAVCEGCCGQRHPCEQQDSNRLWDNGGQLYNRAQMHGSQHLLADLHPPDQQWAAEQHLHRLAKRRRSAEETSN